MIDWNFPLNNDGKEDGLNDPGIETFRNDPIRALAREINQNSCDAADHDSQKPVEVHFSLLSIPRTKFPGIASFEKALVACERYWTHNASARRFFERARHVMAQKAIPTLRISDFNTTGLHGASGGHQSDWFKLTKSVGASDKQGGAGGSFGIGKHAPFACSDIRTVFYGTRDKSKKVAFQGVARLVTHYGKKKQTTQGTGYYGIVAQNAPITKQADIPSLFRRTQTGTDVFVPGFHQHSQAWQADIIKSVLDNFFVSIHEGRLIVRVGEIVLNHVSLAQHIRDLGARDSEFRAHAYYGALTSEEAQVFVDENFEGLGRLELRILLGKHFPRRIAMVRSTGMKIYDKMGSQTPVRFAGVLLAKGQKLNEALRSMEPPSHDDWQPERHEDPSYAKSLKRKLYAWINDRVRSLSAEDEAEFLDVDGLSQFLPDDVDEATREEEGAVEGERSEPTLGEIDVQLRTAETYERYAPDRGVATSGGGLGGPDEGYDGDGDGGDGGGGTYDRRGADDDDSVSGIRPQAGGSSPAAYSKRVGLQRLRVYCADPAGGLYKILFEPELSGKGYVSVNVIGEVGEEAAPIAEARSAAGRAKSLSVEGGRIGPLTFEKGKRVSLELVLRDSLHCALGVSAYAD